MEKTVKTAKQLVEETGNGVVSVAPDALVIAVLQTMADNNVSAVLVMDEQKLLGIVTARDYVLKVELLGRNARDTRAHEIMTRDLLCVSADDSSERCMSIMHNKQVRHLPVIEQGSVIGTLSMRDVLEEVVAEDEHLIKDLERERIESSGETGGSY
ncbi:CBS domain-containing protein [Aromatoleum buckelii]|uniref:CBS domain-containing protein n=1 Tax=Aromatoleum buckelii TaxID=200254 RepID=A0ABX1N590_9RHOO|nr:CBS domain-containing protein [Aromatoleum buckelii]MCK0511726.1 CBS domain-containing protein [Aromatoleum buckelii]